MSETRAPYVTSPEPPDAATPTTSPEPIAEPTPEPTPEAPGAEAPTFAPAPDPGPYQRRRAHAAVKVQAALDALYQRRIPLRYPGEGVEYEALRDVVVTLVLEGRISEDELWARMLEQQHHLLTQVIQDYSTKPPHQRPRPLILPRDAGRVTAVHDRGMAPPTRRGDPHAPLRPRIHMVRPGEDDPPATAIEPEPDPAAG